LGLTKLGPKRIRSVTGSGEANMYGTVRLTIQGRTCHTDVMEVPDDIPVLVGQIPLESLDLVVDPRGARLMGNPEHGGEHIVEMYCGLAPPMVSTTARRERISDFRFEI
jgi:hypothetical protein